MSDNSYNRSIPEEQNKTGDLHEDESELQTMEQARQLSSHYEEIKDLTVDDDTIQGQVKSIDSSAGNNMILVTIDIPGKDQNHEKRFKKPKVWSSKYAFVRWISYYGYDADSFPNMLRDKCKVKVEKENKGNYSVFVPENVGKDYYIEKPIKLIKSFYETKSKPVITIPSIILLIVHTIAVMGNLISYEMSVGQFTGATLIAAIFLAVMLVIEIDFLVTNDD